MSGYSEEVECGRCGGLYHVSFDSSDPYGNYGYCLDCGIGCRMLDEQWTLEELNEERKTWELEPLKKLPYSPVATKFKDLKIGEKFEFVYLNAVLKRSMKHGPWKKISPRKYEHCDDKMVCRVGTINVRVERE